MHLAYIYPEVYSSAWIFLHWYNQPVPLLGLRFPDASVAGSPSLLQFYPVLFEVPIFSFQFSGDQVPTFSLRLPYSPHHFHRPDDSELYACLSVLAIHTEALQIPLAAWPLWFLLSMRKSQESKLSYQGSGSPEYSAGSASEMVSMICQRSARPPDVPAYSPALLPAFLCPYTGTHVAADPYFG